MERSSDGKSYLVMDPSSGNTYRFGAESEAKQFEISINRKQNNGNAKDSCNDNPPRQWGKKRKSASKKRRNYR